MLGTHLGTRKNEISTPNEAHVDSVETEKNTVEEDVREKKTKTKKRDTKDIIWFGTSISKALDIKKFESEMNTKVKFVKAFGIVEEAGHFYPKSNFTDTVAEVLENSTPGAIILQTGSIEISNMDIKKAWILKKILSSTEKNGQQRWRKIPPICSMWL